MVVAITVSVHYDNLLDLVLPQNYKFFKKWYIVTEESDTKTLEVIRKHGFDNVEVLYFDFRKNSTFNKGGGVQFALDKVDKGETVLLVDSDIYIEDEFVKCMYYPFEEDTLYSFTRHDYYSYDHFKRDLVDSVYPMNFMGFFQLFKHNHKYAYQDSENCRECDSVFMSKFPRLLLIEGKVIKHLGRDNVNHFGRKNHDDFLFE